MNTPWETPPLAEDPRDDDEREQAMHAANARDAARYRFLRTSSLLPDVLAHELDAAVDAGIARATPLQEATDRNIPSNQRTALEELVRTATEVHRISNRTHDAWIALAAALNQARDVMTQPDETSGEPALVRSLRDEVALHRGFLFSLVEAYERGSLTATMIERTRAHLSGSPEKTSAEGAATS